MENNKGFLKPAPDEVTVIQCKEKGDDTEAHYFCYKPVEAAGFPQLEVEIARDSISKACDYEYLSCDEKPPHIHKYYKFELTK